MIRLKSRSYELLKKCLEAHRPDLVSVVEFKEDYFDENLYNELREAVCDELILNGFEGDKPTEYGIELESLIDEIGRLFM